MLIVQLKLPWDIILNKVLFDSWEIGVLLTLADDTVMTLKDRIVAPFYPVPASSVTSPHFKVSLDVNQDVVEDMEEVTLGYRAVLPKATQVFVRVVMEQEYAPAFSSCPGHIRGLQGLK